MTRSVCTLLSVNRWAHAIMRDVLRSRQRAFEPPIVIIVRTTDTMTIHSVILFRWTGTTRVHFLKFSKYTQISDIQSDRKKKKKKKSLPSTLEAIELSLVLDSRAESLQTPSGIHRDDNGNIYQDQSLFPIQRSCSRNSRTWKQLATYSPLCRTK